MRAMMVEMALVHGQDLAQVPLTMDEQVIEALAAWRPGGEGAAPGHVALPGGR
ncbi:hypothetical protein ACFFV7_53745 [Nonomuraea spiralis]|uniref:Uncharacterized protein n=1 Tax=Nonomuraea spiralis TaxID=46182 RepID=A0ABV5IZZ4_9ACTN|nr:hypothetical protein [Nonomuraea spiralis]